MKLTPDATGKQTYREQKATVDRFASLGDRAHALLLDALHVLARAPPGERVAAPDVDAHVALVHLPTHARCGTDPSLPCLREQVPSSERCSIPRGVRYSQRCVEPSGHPADPLGKSKSALCRLLCPDPARTSMEHPLTRAIFSFVFPLFPSRNETSHRSVRTILEDKFILRAERCGLHFLAAFHLLP